jgi:hypothetical protein
LTVDLNDLFEALDDSPFEEIPVDIRTFVTSPDYLNQPPLSEYQYILAECMSQIYREADLIRIWGDEGRDHFEKYTKTEVILKLGKGSGKDHTSTIGVAYVVYKLLCLRDPAMYFGKPPGDAIDIINIAVNAEQAKNVFFDNFVKKIRNSPWFVGKYDDKVNNVKFDKSVTVYSGHSERESHEGLNLLIAILDEISGFAMTSAASSNDQAKTSDNIYKAFRGSVDSRFPDYGKVVLLSFPRYDKDYISQIYDSVVAEKDVIIRSHTFVLDPSLPPEAPGNSFDIEWEEDHIIRYEIPRVFALCRPTWEVNPTRHIDEFAGAFFRDPQDSLMRFACMPGKGTDTFFKSREKIETCLKLHNPVDSKRVFDPNFRPNPETTYYVHADLAQQHDKCAVAISHVDKWVKMQMFNDYQQVVPFVVVDAIAWWEPHKEGPVDISDVRDFIVNLRRMGFNLGLVSFDRWNSFDIQRELQSIGIKTETVSVAKKHYEDLAMLFYDERLAGPHNDILLDELLELRILPNGKIDHPRKKSKDLSDALAGSVTNAIRLGKSDQFGEVEIHTPSTMARQERLDEQEAKVIEMPDDIANYLKGFQLI